MRVFAFDLLTGDQIAPLMVADDMSWRASLTQPGEGTFRVLVRDARSPLHPDVVERLLQDWATVIVVEDAGHVHHAGIVTRDRWSSATGVLTLQTIEIAQLLTKRLHTDVHSYTPQGVVLSGDSIRSLQREVVHKAFLDGPGRWRLPVDLPERRFGPMVFEWFGFNFKTAQAALDELAGMTGAGHMFLRPGLGGGRLRWRLEIGDPRLDAGTIRIPGATSQVPIVGRATNIEVQGDGVDRMTGVIAVGDGSGEDKTFGRAGSERVQVAPWGPWLDSTVTVSQIDNPAQLDLTAAGELEARAWKLTQIDFDVMQGDWLTPGLVRPGSTVVLDWPGDERLPAGRYGQYVLAVSGGAGPILTLDTQEV